MLKENRDFKGVWIDQGIWLDKNLSATEKCLLAEIDSLDNKDHCYAKNEYFAEFLGVSVPTISRCIQKLISLNYVESIVFTGRNRILKSMIRLPNQNDQAASSKRSGSLVKKIRPNTNTSTSTNTNTYTEEFLTFWEAYPRNTNKRGAFKRWLKLIKDGVAPDLITRCAANYAAKIKTDKTEINFMLHAATFLGPDRRFEDFETAEQTSDIPPGYFVDKNDTAYQDGVKVGHYDGSRFIPSA